MGLEVAIGIGVISFILCYIAFNIEAEKHVILKLFLILSAIGILIFVPKAAYDDANTEDCSILLDTTTEVNTTRGFIPGATCYLNFTGTGVVLMTEDSTNEFYYYNDTNGLGSTGLQNWNVTCSKIDEDSINVADNLTIYS